MRVITIDRCMHTYMHTYIYIYICIWVCAFPLFQIIGDRYVKRNVWINKIVEENKTRARVYVAANHIERLHEFL